MPRYRQGSKVPINVYDGDRPLFQAHSVEDAERLTELLNAGLDAERYRLALVAVVDEDSAGFGCSTSTSLRSACRTPHSGRTLLSGEGATSWCPSCIATDALTSPETPPGSPVSEIEPVGAQDPPETAGAHTGACAWGYPSIERQLPEYGAPWARCLRPTEVPLVWTDGDGGPVILREFCFIHAAEAERLAGWERPS